MCQNPNAAKPLGHMVGLQAGGMIQGIYRGFVDHHIPPDPDPRIPECLLTLEPQFPAASRQLPSEIEVLFEVPLALTPTILKCEKESPQVECQPLGGQDQNHSKIWVKVSLC